MTDPIDLATEVPSGRWRRLKEATEATHSRLDHRIMAAAPFSSRERYGQFVRVQHAFHQDIADLYAVPELRAAFPDLPGRRRLASIGNDLADLGLDPGALPAAAPFAAQIDVPTAIGWLYVAEGSNLGAAFLLKAAARLGLSESFGARHLAAAPEGRGLNWRQFTNALDAIPLAGDEEERVFAGARAAFSRVHALVESALPVAAATERDDTHAAAEEAALS